MTDGPRPRGGGSQRGPTPDPVRRPAPGVADLRGRLLSGFGSPEGAVFAGMGVVYQDTDPAGGGSIWRKATASGNTGWVELSGGGGFGSEFIKVGGNSVFDINGGVGGVTTPILFDTTLAQSGSGITLNAQGALVITDPGYYVFGTAYSGVVPDPSVFHMYQSDLVKNGSDDGVFRGQDAPLSWDNRVRINISNAFQMAANSKVAVWGTETTSTSTVVHISNDREFWAFRVA